MNFDAINFTKWYVKRKFRICCRTKLERKTTKLNFTFDLKKF